MTARHSHLLLFILISPWKLGVVALSFTSAFKNAFAKKSLPYFTKQHGCDQTHQAPMPPQREVLVEGHEIGYQ